MQDPWCPEYSDVEDGEAGASVHDDDEGGPGDETIEISAASGAGGGEARQEPLAHSQAKDPPKASASASASAKSGAGGRRTLKRRRSEGKPPQVDVVNRLCLWGHPLRSPVVVHPVWQDTGGRSWIAVNEHLGWLRRACTPDGSSRYEEAFQSAVSALRRDLNKGLTDHMESLATEASSSAAQSQAQAREALGLDDDEAASEPETKTQRWGRRGRPPLSLAAELEVDVAGTRVCMKRTTRPLMVEVTMSSVAPGSPSSG